VLCGGNQNYVFGQHSELDSAETGRLCVLAFMPLGSGSRSDSSKRRALPNPLVRRSKAYGCDPSPGDVLRASLGGAGPESGRALRCPALWGCWPAAVSGPRNQGPAACFSPGSAAGAALRLAGSLPGSFAALNTFLEYILETFFFFFIKT